MHTVIFSYATDTWASKLPLIFGVERRNQHSECV